MNTTVRNPLHRRLAAVGGVAVAIAVVAALLLIGPAPARASAPGVVKLDATRTPPVPPPLNPPLTTPEPGGSTTVQSSGAHTDLNAVPFRPKLQLKRGQLAALAQGANKPAGGQSVSGSATKPAGQHPGPQSAHTPPDYSQSLVSAQGWNLFMYEDFEASTIASTAWILEDFSADGFDRQWDTNTWISNLGVQSAWPAAGGANKLNPKTSFYPDNMNSWMERQFNFTGMTDVFVDFALWYNTEPQYDWVYFCISTDFQNYNCDWWSGNSNGWLDQSYWLTSYAGYSQVWLAWAFTSDSTVSDGYDGPFVDDIQVWGDNTPPVTPTPNPAGQLIQNGGFEDPTNNFLNHWNTVSTGALGAAGSPPDQRPALTVSDSGNGPSAPGGGVGAQAVDVVTSTYAEGAHSARLWSTPGTDFLYQTFTVPGGANGLVLDYWFALPTYETNPRTDWYCASIRPGGNPQGSILVDLGCQDATSASGYWQESNFTLTSAQVLAIKGQSVALVFELYNVGTDSTDATAVYIDYVQVYATGGGAAAVDAHEPNNDLASATTGLACGGTITGTVGDALGGYDIDWFKLNITGTVSLQLDINAQTKVQDPRSTLDSVLRLYNAGGTQIDVNDDDGVTYDSFISRTVSAGTYYASVESFTGAGGPNAYYDLAERCNSTEVAPVGGNVQAPPADTWTVMLYLNGEDASFAPILTQYRHDIEAFIAGKPFLKVVILYDGPNNGDTVRYLVQPNGNYTPGVNMWTNPNEVNMGDPDTLANFVRGAMDQYPAENYYLAIDDHGNGTSGTSWDTHPNPNNQPQLTPPEIYSALKDATQNGARKINIVDFESCLMGLAENAYDMRQWADYVVFSEQISWGINTYPVYFSDLAAADTPLTVGRRIVDRYSAGAIAQHFPHTISLVDTSRLPALRTDVTSFANALVASNDRTLINQARTASQAFAASNDATNPYFADYIDLYDFAAQASSRFSSNSNIVSAAAAVQAAVQAAVIDEHHVSGGITIGTTYNWNHSRAHGLSIYFPTDRTASSFDDYVAQTLYQMTQVDATAVDGTWDEFLDWVYLVSGGVGGHNGRGMGASRTEFRLTNDPNTITFVTLPLYLPLVRK